MIREDEHIHSWMPDFSLDLFDKLPPFFHGLIQNHVNKHGGERVMTEVVFIFNDPILCGEQLRRHFVLDCSQLKSRILQRNLQKELPEKNTKIKRTKI